MINTLSFGAPKQIGTDIYAFKSFVNVGDGGEGHLTTNGIAARILQGLGEGDAEARVLQRDAHTSAKMLAEEEAFVESVKRGDPGVSFEIDTTTTLIRLGDGSFAVHSPSVAFTEAARAEMARALGVSVEDFEVSALIAPNLQHWLGVEGWARAFPAAMIYVAPPSHGEDLEAKLPASVDRGRVSQQRRPAAGAQRCSGAKCASGCSRGPA